MRRAVLIALATSLALAAPAAARDYASTALNIVPSGEYGSVPPPPGADLQAQMYDGLTPLFGSVTNRDLFRYFKSEHFGVRGQGPTHVEAIPRRGARIVRDRFDVAHITGRTRDDAIFAAGWVLAEDRGLLLAEARGPARVAAVDAPGVSAFDIVKKVRTFVPTAQDERVLARQTNLLRSYGRKGRRLLHDIDTYVSGINAYYRATHSSAAPFTRNDIYAFNALLAQFLGQGGGDEARRSMLLDGLERRYGARGGLTIFNDLRERQDPEAPVSLDGRFPYAPVPRRRTGNEILDDGSLQPVSLAPSLSAPTPPANASNALLVESRRSATGHPLFVAGPQIGYYYPGLTFELDIHAPGLDARGVSSAPFPGYILIGRGPNYAWSLTSAHNDLIDQYVETLCGNDTTYRFRGRCRPMGTFDAGTLKGQAGAPDEHFVFRMTVHGPVIGYATVRGRRVAISRKRSSFGREVLFQLMFGDLSTGRVTSARRFLRAASQVPATFNAVYANDRDVAMFSAGRLPIRPPDVDPGLPTEGTGAHEWRGFLSARAHPQEINPRGGLLTQWNNRPARGFGPSDDRFVNGPVQRVELLRRGLARHRVHTLATVVSAMNRAATQDLRVIEVWPVIASVLKTGSPPNARLATMIALLDRWRRNGGSRLDRNLDGKIDDPGAAIMDVAWPKIADAVMAPVLGPQLAEFKAMEKPDSPPFVSSGEFFEGWYSYVQKDLRTLLGRPVRGRYHTRFCGRGNLAQCRASLYFALEGAAQQLAGAQGADPAAWRSDATLERHKFIPGLLPTTLRWTNRPSGIQQVITFTGHPRR